MRRLLVFACLLCLPAVVWGQGTTAADRVRLTAGPCVITSQAGPPIAMVLDGTCSTVTTAAATNLTLSPTGDLITDPAGNDILPNLNYDINLGMLSKKFLTLHAAELWVETLVAQNTIATIGGRVLVAPTNVLTSDIGTGATSILVKYNNLASGDRVYMEADGKVEFMAITSGASGGGPYTYSVTRNLDGSGANDWYAGDAVLNTGQAGNGFIDLYSVRGVKSSGEIGPSIVGNVRLSSTYNDWAPRWAIGNLNGVYGYSGSTYGAAFGDASATNVTVDATNGFRIRSSTTNKFHADTSGNLSITGDLSVGTAGVIRSNATGFSTGTGYWLDYNSGTPRFRVGVPGGAGLEWDGTSLVVRGTAGSSTNMLHNTDCAVSTTGWTVFEDHDVTETFSFGLDPWDLNNAGGTCYLFETGTPANGTFSLAQTSTGIPVIEGQRYEASAYMGVHGSATNADVAIVYLDSASSIVGFDVGNNCVSGGTGGYYLEDYCRSGVISTAPATAVTAYMRVQRIHDGTQLNPATFFAHMFFGQATSTQIELSAWGPPGVTTISGGLIETGAVTADKISVTDLYALNATIGGWAITSTSLTATAGAVGLSSAITGGDDIRIFAGNATPSSAPFRVTEAGVLTATSGTIGGWTIGSTTLTGGDMTLDNAGDLTAGTGNNVVRISDTGTYRFWIGHATAGSAPFRVEPDGDVLMASGAVTVDSGGINITGGTGSVNSVNWTDGSKIYSSGDSLQLHAQSGGAVTLAVNSVGILWDGADWSPLSSGKDLGQPPGTTWRHLYLTGNISSSGLAGTGNDYACIDSSGQLFRSDTAC